MENKSYLKVYVLKRLSKEKKEFYVLNVELYDAEEDDLTSLVKPTFLDKATVKLLKKCGVEVLESE